MSLKVLGKGIISGLIKDIIPNTLSITVQKIIDNWDSVKNYIIERYWDIAEWVEEQLNQLNGRAETCEGES